MFALDTKLSFLYTWYFLSSRKQNAQQRPLTRFHLRIAIDWSDLYGMYSRVSINSLDQKIIWNYRRCSLLWWQPWFFQKSTWYSGKGSNLAGNPPAWCLVALGFLSREFVTMFPTPTVSLNWRAIHPMTYTETVCSMPSGAVIVPLYFCHQWCFRDSRLVGERGQLSSYFHIRAPEYEVNLFYLFTVWIALRRMYT